jgi:ferritin
MTFVFQEDPPMSISILESLKKAQKKKTLGLLINALRERVVVHPSFDGLLRAFLKHRNSFIHDLDRISGLDFDTKDGQRKFMEFLTTLFRENSEVTAIFAAFIDAWAKQVGIHPKLHQTNTEFYSSIFYAQMQKSISPVLNQLVTKKIQ